MYANNSVIDINLVGEGFEEPQITDGGALECHTDDTTCCSGIDNPDGPGRGEWYYPNGTAVPPPGGGTRFYRTRGHMVIRLNRVDGKGVSQTGIYQCEIPGAGGVIITRYITLSNTRGLLVLLQLSVIGLWWCSTDINCNYAVRCDDLPGTTNGTITYTPLSAVSSNALPPGQRFIGTIATYSCSPGYQLVGGSSLRA